MRRCVFLACLIGLAACAPAPAAGPVETVQALYAPYVAKQTAPSIVLESEPWTHEMGDMVRRGLELSQQRGEPIAINDFDLVTDSQDGEISDVRVDMSEPVHDGRAQVRARFKNTGEENVVLYDMKLEDGRWRIDNMRGAQWTLRELLATDGIGPPPPR